eukprot:GHVU01040714.1.p1 GENE.GHVU01040714.1~~GHVU01040714.1.p1  ORF type:complete len:654 (-),score=120.25 GHVU01040714.1:31-1992(-)
MNTNTSSSKPGKRRLSTGSDNKKSGASHSNERLSGEEQSMRVAADRSCKRIKLPVEDSHAAPQFSNGVCPAAAAGGEGEGDGGAEAATQLHHPHAHLGGRWQGLARQEVVLLLLQTLDALGYRDSRLLLERESSVRLETVGTRLLHEAVERGAWDEALHRLLHSSTMGLSTARARACRFVILEHKYIELLRDRNLRTALQCLREELTSAAFDLDTDQRVHRCASLLMCCDEEALSERVSWNPSFSRAVLWERLLTLLPRAAAPLKPHRLGTLLHQSLEFQKSKCHYHNPALDSAEYASSSSTLLSDHVCPSQPIPSRVLWSLDGHTDEVWFVAASPSGRYLASSSKDRTIIIWQVDGEEFQALQVCKGHSDAVGYLEWSPDETKLASGSNDNSIRIWTPGREAATHVIANSQSRSGDTISQRHNSVTALAWLPDSRRLLGGYFGKELILWRLGGDSDSGGDNDRGGGGATELHRWQFGSRLQDLCLMGGGVVAVVVCSDKTLRVLCIKSRRELFCLPEQSTVTSLTKSRLYPQILVNVSDRNPVIRLWDVAERRVVQRYRGHSQGRFVVRSAFGGVNESFVVSGSEDSRLYVWSRFYGSLLRVLAAHTATVNCVIWPPVAGLGSPWLISASDDRSLIVWAAAEALQDDDAKFD